MARDSELSTQNSQQLTANYQLSWSPAVPDLSAHS
jgi:hypothetical protein